MKKRGRWKKREIPDTMKGGWNLFGGSRPKFTVQGPESWKKPDFLRAYATYGTVSRACQRVRTAYTTYARWKDDPLFVQWLHVFDEALTDKLEATAYKRALAGSDTLAIFLLKARKPKVYRERQSIEMSGYLEGSQNEAEDKEREIRVNQFLSGIVEKRRKYLENKLEDKSEIIDADIK